MQRAQRKLKERETAKAATQASNVAASRTRAGDRELMRQQMAAREERKKAKEALPEKAMMSEAEVVRATETHCDCNKPYCKKYHKSAASGSMGNSATVTELRMDYSDEPVAEHMASNDMSVLRKMKMHTTAAMCMESLADERRRIRAMVPGEVRDEAARVFIEKLPKEERAAAAKQFAVLSKSLASVSPDRDISLHERRTLSGELKAEYGTMVMKLAKERRARECLEVTP